MKDIELKLSLIAPAYNEQGCIKEFVQEANHTFDENGYAGEILVVNDASRDHTLQILQSLQEKFPRLRIISHKRNLGLTSAMITGIENAQNDIIVFMSSDLESHPREDIPKLKLYSKLIRGLTQTEINKIRKIKKHVYVRDGVRSGIVFPINLLITIIYGNVLLVIL